MTMQETPIYFSERDYERLRGLVDGRIDQTSLRHSLSELERELDRAEVVPEAALPTDVVAMHSTVRLVDLDTDAEHVYTVVYPHEADVDRGRISVLAPVGTAVLGYRAGDVVEWEVPGGRRRFRIEAVAA
jgi:regulator of nucleoside diphosphate kinase